MITFLLLIATQLSASPAAITPAPSTSAINPLEAIRVYAGAWTVTSSKTMAGPGKPDLLVNRCFMATAFYNCEQQVNGKVLALVVFTATSLAGAFHTQPMLPNGQATGRGDLTITGDHWVFTSKTPVATGKTSTWYRTENFFTGRDHIHFDQYESADGVTWTKSNSGDEVRVPMRTPHP